MPQLKSEYKGSRHAQGTGEMAQPVVKSECCSYRGPKSSF